MFLLSVSTKMNVKFWLLCIGSSIICCLLWLEYIDARFFGPFYLDELIRKSLPDGGRVGAHWLFIVWFAWVIQAAWYGLNVVFLLRLPISSWVTQIF